MPEGCTCMYHLSPDLGAEGQVLSTSRKAPKRAELAQEFLAQQRNKFLRALHQRKIDRYWGSRNL